MKSRFLPIAALLAAVLMLAACSGGVGLGAPDDPGPGCTGRPGPGLHRATRGWTGWETFPNAPMRCSSPLS